MLRQNVLQLKLPVYYQIFVIGNSTVHVCLTEYLIRKKRLLLFRIPSIFHELEKITYLIEVPYALQYFKPVKLFLQHFVTSFHLIDSSCLHTKSNNCTPSTIKVILLPVLYVLDAAWSS